MLTYDNGGDVNSYDIAEQTMICAVMDCLKAYHSRVTYGTLHDFCRTYYELNMNIKLNHSSEQRFINYFRNAIEKLKNEKRIGVCKNSPYSFYDLDRSKKPKIEGIETDPYLIDTHSVTVAAILLGYLPGVCISLKLGELKIGNSFEMDLSKIKALFRLRLCSMLKSFEVSRIDEAHEVWAELCLAYCLYWSKQDECVDFVSNGEKIRIEVKKLDDNNYSFTRLEDKESKI